MKLLINNEIQKQKWNRILTKSEFASPFQTPDFYDLYNSIDSFSADVFAVEEGGNYKSLVVVTIQKEKGIKGFFSRRGIIYGGPLLLSLDKKALQTLINGLKDYYKRKLIFLEIRNNNDIKVLKDMYRNQGWISEDRLNVKLNLENKNIDDVLSLMKYNRRREIKLSYKEGAVNRLAVNEEEVVKLFEILKDLYANRVKLPLPSKSYFLNLFKSKIGKVFVVIHNEHLIGGAFCFYDENVIYTSYYVGLRHYHKKIFPTHIAIMGVLEFAIENNLKIIDFMGAGKPNEDYGVRDFKLEFGGDLVENERYSLIFNPLLFNVGKLGLKILAKI